MSKRGYISRYLLVVKKLKASPYASFEDIQQYLERQLNFLLIHDDTLAVGFSKRTFQRDIREISNLFGIDIEYSKKEKGYIISQSESESMNFQRMIEAFDLFNSLNISNDIKPFIHVETRRPSGTEHLFGLIHAIKNTFKIKFIYSKYDSSATSIRQVEPYALKEFKNRWYIVAKDLSDETVKSFALDRMNQLEITTVPFHYPSNFDIEEYYRYSFGIIGPNGGVPTEVILSFDPIQGKYIKSLPLHSSQELIVENNTEIQVKLKLCITDDFIMELLSFSDSVKVIRPKALVNLIKTAHENAAALYH
jgi:predicted DNA-binding transcriptional regulator YafY